MSKKHCGVLNAKACKIRSGEEFKKWLNTIPIEYHESIISHRRTFILIIKSKNG